MRIKGKINGVSLVVLLDTGSTHNVIDAALVPGLKLAVDQSHQSESLQFRCKLCSAYGCAFA